MKLTQSKSHLFDVHVSEFCKMQIYVTASTLRMQNSPSALRTPPGSTVFQTLYTLECWNVIVLLVSTLYPDFKASENHLEVRGLTRTSSCFSPINTFCFSLVCFFCSSLYSSYHIQQLKLQDAQLLHGTHFYTKQMICCLLEFRFNWASYILSGKLIPFTYMLHSQLSSEPTFSGSVFHSSCEYENTQGFYFFLFLISFLKNFYWRIVD